MDAVGRKRGDRSPHINDQMARALICPLCGASLAHRTIKSNSQALYNNLGRLVSFRAGLPSMQATCLNGCRIEANAAKPRDSWIVAGGR